MKRSHQAKCPTCGKGGNWLVGPYAPFCSRRCQLVDLGKWLGEEHAISEPLRPSHLQDLLPDDASAAPPRPNDTEPADPEE